MGGRCISDTAMILPSGDDIAFDPCRARVADPPAPASADSVVVTADRMVDVLTGRVVEEPVIVATDGRIVSVVGRGGARPIIPAGARRIDLPGMTILPGLIDMHVHLDQLALHPRLSAAGVHRQLLADDRRAGNARDMLEAGFTTVRNVGSDRFADVGLRQAIDAGRDPGPRIVPAGPCSRRDRRPLRQRPSAALAINRDGRARRNGPEACALRVRAEAPLRRPGDQGLRHRRRLLAQHRAGPAAAVRSGDCRRDRRRGAHAGACASPPTPMARPASAPRSAPASTRSSMLSLIDAEGIRLARERGTWLVDGHLQHRIHPGRRRARTASSRTTCRRTARSRNRSATISAPPTAPGCGWCSAPTPA